MMHCCLFRHVCLVFVSVLITVNSYRLAGHTNRNYHDISKGNYISSSSEQCHIKKFNQRQSLGYRQGLTRHQVSLKDFQEKYFKIMVTKMKKFVVNTGLITTLIMPRTTLSVMERSTVDKPAISKDSLYGSLKSKLNQQVTSQTPETSSDTNETPNTHEIILKQREEIRKYGTSFVRDAVKSVGPSVVRIDCEREVHSLASLFQTNENGFREIETVKISGSGIVVSSDGYLVTNAHVVQDARKIVITLSNGRSFKVKCVAFDELTDLAVLKADIDDSVSLTPAPLGDSSKLQSGDWVIAVGCPVGLDFTVTLGIVSNPKRSNAEVGVPFLKGHYIQTDAALNSGNSGGPLVNDEGQVIGINTMVRTNTEAIGFAIPINRVKDIYGTLKQGKKPNHAYFGVDIISLTPDYAKIHNDDPNASRLPEIHGALVVKVTPNSPAALSGMRKFDVITEVNGHKVIDCADAEVNMDVCKPGSTSKIRVARGEEGTSVDLNPCPQDLLTVIEERKRRQSFALKPGNDG